MISPYSLLANATNSDRFYHECSAFADTFCETTPSSIQALISNFMKWIELKNTEQLRSREEYTIELLTIGLLWDRYSGAAVHSKKLHIYELKSLYRLRRKTPQLKPILDPIRGILSDHILVQKIKRYRQPSSPEKTNLSRWFLWLEASGEFHDETDRIANWLKWVETDQESPNGSDLIEHATLLYTQFSVLSAERLGTYTSGIPSFIRDQYPKYRYREDQLFCGKSEPEYHLNMLAMELINRAFRPAFLKTKRRIVLLPGCMRGIGERSCKAVVNGSDIRCSHCREECRISQITKEGKHGGFEVAIVPHSGGFSKWLERFAFSGEYGVIAVACVLNIAVGGYEMRRQGIPSQCVLLDYCGCKKHWDPQGIATDLNSNQLQKVIQI